MSRGPQKRFLDIEQVLRWAYRDELPKRQRQGPTFADLDRPPELRPSADFFDDDGAVREPGFPAALGEPHPDALAIEAAVRNLAQWRGHGFGQEPDNPDPAGLTFGFTGLECGHQEAALEAIGAMAGIVACHARAGTRPRWSPENPRPYADTGGNGKPRVLIDEVFAEVYDRRRDRMKQVAVSDLPNRRVPPGSATWIEAVPSPPLRKGVYRVGTYWPLKWRPDPAKIVAERAEWAGWRMGLQLLWQGLEGTLSSIAPLPPSAPWQPWCFDTLRQGLRGSAGEREAHGKPPELFRGLRQGAYRRETREQAAARRRAGLRRELQARGEETRPIGSGKRNLRSAG